MKKIPLILLGVFAGCQGFTHEAASHELLMKEARQALDTGEYYRARQLTGKVLESDPASEEAQKLMAQILDKEIARHKEAFDTARPEDLDKDEKRDQAKTWLERARELYHEKQYEEALDAAEKVFTFDPENVAASSLVDDIRNEVFAEGKQDAVFLKKMYSDEIEQRVTRYKAEAREKMEAKQWGPAKLSIQKILLLKPDDNEAQELLKEVQGKEGALSS
ncbi:MAG TPA: hypothetical protein VL688_01600 [Verrucomicrobiae bacterium]|nr:hypothetical protein [Verrucomicrobiae bacterium]